MKKKVLSLLLAGIMTAALAGCGGTGASASSSASGLSAASEVSAESAGADSSSVSAETTASVSEENAAGPSSSVAEANAAASSVSRLDKQTEIQVFIAASLNKVMTEIAEKYNEEHPDVKITFNADSSGTLLTQIEEGYACDLFFSAAQKQMDTLQNDDKLVVDGTRHNVVNNQVVVITRKDSGTKVTGLENIGKASSIALADGSVPVGRYTRVALMNLGILGKTDDPASYTTQQVSDALGGVEISEQGNVSKVLAAVVEGSCEVGTTYKSDTYGYEDQLDILQTVGYDLTGNVIYPIAQVQNDEADDAEKAAAADFESYVLSDDAKTIFQKYYFDTNVTDD